MKTSSIAVETSRSISQSDSIVRQTNKRSFLSDTTMNNIHIFNDIERSSKYDYLCFDSLPKKELLLELSSGGRTVTWDP